MNFQQTQNKLGVRILTPAQGFIPDFCWNRIIEGKNIIEGLKNEMDDMNHRDPIMIDAGTGAGKTTWVYEECIPRAMHLEKNVLLLSNRIALSHQQKLKIMEITNSPKQGCLTEKGIREESDFGNVRVITYHKLPEFINEKGNEEWISNLMYVIFDEAHFFVADSQFNNMCDYYLKIATSRFCHAIRVYMTATSWDVLYPIATAEEKNYFKIEFRNHWVPSRTLKRYYFPRNFERYKLNFFNSLSELKKLIQDTTDEKWLIFVDNKEKGKQLMSELGSDAEYIDAKSKASEAWKSILSNECFNCRILIATSVLDCGVNIKDSSLKNIAVITDNRTSMMQMIGRKRLSENEILKIWVYDIPIDSIKKRYNELCKLLEWFKAYDECQGNIKAMEELATKIWDIEDLKLHKLFRLSGNLLYKNELARFQLKRNFEFLKRIIEGKTTFKSEVYQWLEKEDPHEASYLDQLKEYCETHMQKQLSESDCDTLRNLIVKAYENCVHKEVQHTRKDTLKERALNNRLIQLEVPYKILNTGKYWTIQEAEE